MSLFQRPRYVITFHEQVQQLEVSGDDTSLVIRGSCVSLFQIPRFIITVHEQVYQLEASGDTGRVVKR